MQGIVLGVGDSGMKSKKVKIDTQETNCDLPVSTLWVSSGSGSLVSCSNPQRHILRNCDPGCLRRWQLRQLETGPDPRLPPKEKHGLTLCGSDSKTFPYAPRGQGPILPSSPCGQGKSLPILYYAKGTCCGGEARCRSGNACITRVVQARPCSVPSWGLRDHSDRRHLLLLEIAP